ncbi:MAG: hypothetical protein RPS47_14775 [Colwellia sp.]|jgi:hypothetical protein
MKPNIVLCSHDAGGANLLISWALKHPENQYWGLLDGPAIKLYSNSRLEFKRLQNIDHLSDSFQSCVCSSGWQSDWEKKCIKTCIDRAIDVNVYFDHWVNFRSRLLLHDCLLKPNRIWVVDTQAQEIARQVLPEITAVNVIGNHYDDDMVSKIRGCKESNLTSVLICLEPIRDKGVVAESLWAILSLYIKTEFKDAHIVIRPHPSGELDGTQHLLESLGACMSVELSSATLDKDLARSYTVIGYQSSIFTIAHKINKKILSYYPIHCLSPLLPHSYINYIPMVV